MVLALINCWYFSDYLLKMQRYSSFVNKGDAIGQALGGSYGLYIANQIGQIATIVMNDDAQGRPILTQAAVITLNSTPSKTLGRQGQTSVLAIFWRLFGVDGTHSNYSCVGSRCGAERQAR